LDKIFYFDLIVLLLICLLGFKGLVHGLIRELFGLIGIIGGFFAASHSASAAANILGLFVEIDNPYLQKLFGFIVSFLVFWLCAYILSIIISKIFHISGLGSLDSIGGFLFGFLKAFFIFSIVVYFITKIEFLNKRVDSIMTNSFIYPLLKDSGNFIMTSEEVELQSKLDEVVNEAKESLSEQSVKIISNKAGKQIENLAQDVASKIKQQVNETAK